MSTDIRSAPRTGNELPILKVCKTLGTWKPALVEVTVREISNMGQPIWSWGWIWYPLGF